MAVNNTQEFLPVSSTEFDDLMSVIGYFEPKPTLAVATSGGADSMALLLLAHQWANKNGGKVISITVNHNLRPEAKEEAEYVADFCARLGIEHNTLSWKYHKKPDSAIQAQARAARYELLTDYCRNNDILHLLTAHHQGDQAETLFLRLIHGSNISGLSCMPAQNIVSGVRLLRPLLAIPKERLIAYLKINHQDWIEDPSNQNCNYERVRIRNSLRDNGKIKQSASILSDAFSKVRNILENSIASELTNNVSIYESGYAVIQSAEISLPALSALITTLSGEEHPPRREKLENIHTAIESQKLIRRNIAGLLFEKINTGEILVYREEKAIEQPVIIGENTEIYWDKRFLLKWKNIDPATENKAYSLQIRALGSDGLAKIKKSSPYLLKNMPPARILRCLPSFWLLEELINVPHIAYMAKNTNENISVPAIETCIKFYPAKALAGSSFFVMNKQVNNQVKLSQGEI